MRKLHLRSAGFVIPTSIVSLREIQNGTVVWSKLTAKPGSAEKIRRRARIFSRPVIASRIDVGGCASRGRSDAIRCRRRQDGRLRRLCSTHETWQGKTNAILTLAKPNPKTLSIAEGVQLACDNSIAPLLHISRQTPIFICAMFISEQQKFSV